MVSNPTSKSGEEETRLRTDYEQTNEQIRMLTDIRFKLLALVPIGTTIVVAAQGMTLSENALVLGILGFAIVFAIAIYDQRNSQIYDAYIGRARQLENQLHMFNGGLYNNKPRRDVRLFGVYAWHDRALAFIYGISLGGWFYLITHSLLNFLTAGKHNIAFYVASILIPTLVASIFIWQFHQIEADRNDLRKIKIYRIDKDTSSNKNFYRVKIEFSLENKGKKAFKYKLSEIKLLDKDGKKYANVPELKNLQPSTEDDNGNHNAFKLFSLHIGKFLPKGWRLKSESPNKDGKSTKKVSLESGVRESIHYELPKGSVPRTLVYTPYPEFIHVPQNEHFEYFRKNIVLIRHGERYHCRLKEKAKDAPLTPGGKDGVNRLEEQLKSLNLNPEIYLTSPHVHAMETAEILSDGEPHIVYSIDALAEDTSPSLGQDIFQAIIEASKGKGLEGKTTVAIVGHDPKLHSILSFLISKSVQSVVSVSDCFLNPGEAVWIRAHSFSDFRIGSGEVDRLISDGNIEGKDLISGENLRESSGE